MASAIQQRLLDLATDIASVSPDEIAFTHTVLTQTSLPASQPPEGVRVWERRQGRATLRVEAGSALNPRTGNFEQLGLALRAEGPAAADPSEQRGGPPPVSGDPGRRHDDSLLSPAHGKDARRQAGKAAEDAAVRPRCGPVPHGDQDNERAVQVNTQVVSAFNLWFEKDESQRVLWPSTLKLSLDYYESLTRFAVPLDERAIAALAHSALALDIYCWLAQRLHRIPSGKGQLVPWAALQEQFGQEYARVRKFREFFLAILPQVRSAYPEARIDVDGRA